MSDGGPPGEWGRVGRKGTSGQLGNEKAPRGFPKGPLIEWSLDYRRPFPARAERTIKRKHKAHKARYPRTLRSGFTASPHWKGWTIAGP